MGSGTTPSGNAFLVRTPNLDNLHARIVQEQQQRELQKRQDSKMLDEEFSRNLSGMWDADIPELTTKYGEYKQAWKDLYKKKGGGTPQEQLEVLKKKADMYSTLGKSKEHRNWWETKVKAVQGDKKGLFSDDAPQQLSSLRSVPSSKVDRDAIEPKLLYPYSLPEFDKINKESIGALVDRRGKSTVSATDPLKDETPVWKTANTPNQIFDHLLGSVVSQNKGRQFTGLVLHSMDDQEKENLTNQFIAKTKDPKFIAAYGEVQPFSPTALSTDLGQAVALQTMKNVVDMPIPEPKIESVLNADRATKNRQQFAKEQQARAAANSLARLYVYANIQDRKPENIERNIDGVINNHIETAANDPNNEIIVDSETFKSITGKDKTSSSVLMYKDGKYIDGYKNTDGKIEVRGETPKDLAKIKLTKTFKSGLDSRYNTGNVPTQKPTNSTYTIKGKKYSEAELLKMGYTLDQVSQYKNK